MAYVTAEARQELLDTIAEAAAELGAALAALGDAYEQLDERAADELEDALFKPVQAAYGRARRTHDEFAARHGLGTLPAAAPPAPGAPSRGVRGFVQRAVDHAARAEDVLVELQDSMSPVEVGDAELRAGLADVRSQLEAFRPRAERFAGRIGR